MRMSFLHGRVRDDQNFQLQIMSRTTTCSVSCVYGMQNMCSPAASTCSVMRRRMLGLTRCCATCIDITDAHPNPAPCIYSGRLTCYTCICKTADCLLTPQAALTASVAGTQQPAVLTSPSVAHLPRFGAAWSFPVGTHF